MQARIRHIFLDGYGVFVFRIVIFKISSFNLQNALCNKNKLLWDVIENGNSFQPVAKTTTNADGTSTTLIPGPYKDAKTLFAAIQTRFGGNEATKDSEDSSEANASEDCKSDGCLSQPNGSQLVHEDLEQIHEDDLEEMDLKWLSIAEHEDKKLEKLKQEKESNQHKIENFDNASKSLDKLIGSQIPNKSRKGLGFISYNAVPPPPSGLFSPSNLNLSNSGLEEESPNSPLVEELVSNDKKKTIFPTVSKIEFVRTKQQEKPVRKPVKYDEMYRLTAITIKGKGYLVIIDSMVNYNYSFQKRLHPRDSEEHRQIKANAVKAQHVGLETYQLDIAYNYFERHNYVDARGKSSYYFKFQKNNMYSDEMKNINRVLVVKPHNKTPYELFRGRTPALSFMRPFGCHVTILNTLDHLGKFDGKSDEGFFVRYSMNSDGPKWLFDIDVLTKSMNYVPVVAGTNSNDFVGTKESIGAGHSSKEPGSSQDYILMPLWKDGSLFDSSPKNTSNDEHAQNNLYINTGSLNINTVSPTVTTAPLEATHVDFFGDETKLDISNITNTYLVPTTTSTRIHKHHSLDHVIGNDSPFNLEAYNDSDYAGASLDRKSTTGGCQFLGRRLISWQCKKQTIVANSTTEAEYVAASSCCGQVLWIQNQMLDYGYNFMNTKIHIDNESTICIVKNPMFHSKTKHIEIRHHFIRDSNEKKLIQMTKIHTDHNVTDLLTKAFDVGRFQYLIAIANDEIQVSTVGLPYYWSEGFQEIVDFLNGSHIRYALTKNPIIYVSLIEKFWQTATVRTVDNGEQEITATVDGKEFTITEASVRRHLQSADVDEEGEGSGHPSKPQPPPSTAQPTHEEPIPNVVSSSHQKTQTPRQALNQVTELPQTSEPIPNVPDEAVYEEWDDRVERATTTAASLDAEQASGNINRTQSMAIPNVPLPQ
ncbi:hypothetical protein Tco_0545976 [Tanacetum coccineum]